MPGPAAKSHVPFYIKINLRASPGIDWGVIDGSVPRSTPLQHCTPPLSLTIDQVEYLIAQGTDVNALDWDGATACHWASYKGHAEVLDALIAHGANVDLATVEGKVAMDFGEPHPLRRRRSRELVRGLAVRRANAEPFDAQTQNFLTPSPPFSSPLPAHHHFPCTANSASTGQQRVYRSPANGERERERGSGSGAHAGRHAARWRGRSKRGRRVLRYRVIRPTRGAERGGAWDFEQEGEKARGGGEGGRAWSVSTGGGGVQRGRWLKRGVRGNLPVPKRLGSRRVGIGTHGCRCGPARRVGWVRRSVAQAQDKWSGS